MALSPCLAVRRVRKNDLRCAVLQTLEQDVEDVQVKVGKVRKKGKVKISSSNLSCWGFTNLFESLDRTPKRGVGWGSPKCPQTG